MGVEINSAHHRSVVLIRVKIMKLPIWRFLFSIIICYQERREGGWRARQIAFDAKFLKGLENLAFRFLIFVILIRFFFHFILWKISFDLRKNWKKWIRKLFLPSKLVLALFELMRMWSLICYLYNWWYHTIHGLSFNTEMTESFNLNVIFFYANVHLMLFMVIWL